MARYEPDPKAAAAAAEEAPDVLREAYEEVAETHAGKGADDVREALQDAAAKRGLLDHRPDEDAVDRIARRES